MLIVKSWSELRETIQKFDKKPLLLTATDGNHGYALAFAAKSLGCQAIIFMPKVNIFKSPIRLRSARTRQTFFGGLAIWLLHCLGERIPKIFQIFQAFR